MALRRRQPWCMTPVCGRSKADGPCNALLQHAEDAAGLQGHPVAAFDPHIVLQQSESQRCQRTKKLGRREMAVDGSGQVHSSIKVQTRHPTWCSHMPQEKVLALCAAPRHRVGAISIARHVLVAGANDQQLASQHKLGAKVAPRCDFLRVARLRFRAGLQPKPLIERKYFLCRAWLQGYEFRSRTCSHRPP